MDPFESAPKPEARSESTPPPKPETNPMPGEAKSAPASPRSPAGGKDPKTRTVAEFLTRLAVRLAIVFAVTWAWGELLNLSVKAAAGSTTKPPGFTQGMVHGALMPGAMPMLLIGRDVAIYTVPNQGRLYNLGYAAGVNVCGLIFFGVLFSRVSKLMRRRADNKI